jgi:peptidylprolyl isomerase
MPVRKFLVAAIAVGLVGVGLVGCSSSGSADASCVRPTSPETELPASVTGAFGSEPELDAYTPVHADKTEWTDLIEGDGLAVTSTDQVMLADIVLFNGSTGERLGATLFDGDLAQARPLSEWTKTFPGLKKSLHCAREGGRVLTLLPSGSLPEEAAAGLGLAEDDTAIVSLDLQKVYLAKADGADQFVTENGLPSVVRAPNGRPGIIVPDGAAPTDLKIEVLKKGEGAEVTGDVPVRVAYTGVLWDDRKEFDSSWGKVPVSFSLDQVVDGFADGLRGQTVGSQVLIVVPPKLGYGDKENGAIPANSTLVFVVDILGLDELPE